MHWKSIPRPSPALVVASLALAVALGGTGYAALVLPPNSVGTAQLKNGAVVGAKVKPRSLVAANFKPGALPPGPPGPAGLAGSAGPAGPAGTAGAKGDPATKLWAIVPAAGGQPIKQSGGITAPKAPGVGLYTVTFPQNVNNCSPVVSVSGAGSTPEDGFAAASPGATATQITVQAFSSSGGHADRTFSIAVFC